MLCIAKVYEKKRHSYEKTSIESFKRNVSKIEVFHIFLWRPLSVNSVPFDKTCRCAEILYMRFLCNENQLVSTISHYFFDRHATTST